ncbi:two-pore potassium channel 1-like [Cynara cardunculus var. scolymus]|uniref:two-pore potassium channel 1-like n=1 Tax=Cynara cardunculus var. scolymus TaxID=59895 RepID=UPI000D63037B|nr:two-pore potassium channel 1-like [Cynara cardunculus var. scolymus]
MTSEAKKQDSPKRPRLKDQTASLKRRFRRIKSAPRANSSISNGKHAAPAESLPKPKSVFDHLYPNYWKVAVIFFVYLAAGTLCFHLARHQIKGKKTNSVLDGLYFTIVTMTSVGYGDLSPDSNLTILLACLFVVLGTLIVGLVLSKAADLLVEKQERLLVKALSLNQTLGEREILKKIRTKKVRNKCIILVALLLVFMAAGTGFLLSVEDLDFVHAFYCVIGTLTGLGYIDKCFSTTGGRVFSLFWILLGTIYVAQLLFSFALLHTERRQRSLVKWVLKRKTTTSDLEAADFDGDGIVIAAEFVIYKLKEMGKINEEDITPIMEQFEILDFDKTGTLSTSDLLLSQSELLALDTNTIATRLSI